MSWNATLAPGRTATIGVLANQPELPLGFNGLLCIRHPVGDRPETVAASGICALRTTHSLFGGCSPD